MKSSGFYLGTACTLHRGIVFDEFFDRSLHGAGLVPGAAGVEKL